MGCIVFFTLHVGILVLDCEPRLKSCSQSHAAVSPRAPSSPQHHRSMSLWEWIHDRKVSPWDTIYRLTCQGCKQPTVFPRGSLQRPSQLESLNTNVSSSSRQQTNNWPQLHPSSPHGSLLPMEGWASPARSSPFLPQSFSPEGTGMLLHSFTPLCPEQARHNSCMTWHDEDVTSQEVTALG